MIAARAAVGGVRHQHETSGQATSDGGTGLITVEMQAAGTFLEASWDFMDETASGTEDIWWILEDKDHPRL